MFKVLKEGVFLSLPGGSSLPWDSTEPSVTSMRGSWTVNVITKPSPCFNNGSPGHQVEKCCIGSDIDVPG